MLQAVFVGLGLIAFAALPVGAELTSTQVEVSDVLGANGEAVRGTVLVSDILMADPALSTSHPNLPGGVSDSDGNGVDGNDSRFVDNIEIITIPGTTPRPAYFPVCPSCTLLRAIEFGGPSPFLPVGSAGAIFVDNDLNPTEFIYQVALLNGSLTDGFGRLTGFDYLEQHQSAGQGDRGGLLGNAEGQVTFIDSDGDGDSDTWRVDHLGDSIGPPGEYGPLPFTLDIDVVTTDLNGDGDDDAFSFNDLFNVWDALRVNSGDLAGQVWLPLVDDPNEPGMRTMMFNDTALDSATVAGGALPVIMPVSGGVGVPSGAAIPTIGGWGMAILLAAMALVGWNILRRGGFAAA